MGSSGPTGATGPSGPEGPSGATGPAGSVPITDNTGTQDGTHIVYGAGSLAAGTLTVPLSDAVKFADVTSYVCTANDTQTVEPVQVVNNSGTSFTLNGTGSDSVSYICVGS
jgi:hypothetical protein